MKTNEVEKIEEEEEKMIPLTRKENSMSWAISIAALAIAALVVYIVHELISY